MPNIRLSILKAGVSNLKEFGYPDVHIDNITRDIIYREFFKGMLKDNLGMGADKEINELLAEIEQNEKEA